MPRAAVRFDMAVVQTICLRIADGKSLRAVCKAADMPARENFLDWVAKKPEVRALYEQAIADREERYFEEVIEIADSGRDPAKTRVQVDARKWALACMNPKKYGTRVSNEHSGVDGAPIKTEAIVSVEAGEAYLRMLNGRS